MISLHEFDLPENESSIRLGGRDIVHDRDDPNDFSLWQPAFAVLAPPAEEDAS